MSLRTLCLASSLLASAAHADSYIVTLRDAPSAASVERVATAHGGRISHRYTTALRGFAAELTPEAAAALAADPGVARVEPDAPVRATGVQTNATWGLDRIDQAALPLDGKYTALGDGAGVTVYVFDSGIRASHGEFTGKVDTYITPLADGKKEADCYGHGTHVSGTIAGTKWGVAKQAKIVPVRVLDCTGNGVTSNILAAIDYVTANKVPRSIANLSLGTDVPVEALDTAVRNLIAAGVPTIVSAGNLATDACTQSPARVAEAITVAATTNTDARWVKSSYGSCIDLFAPGVGIVSAGIASDSATQTMEGTSMAAPHVTGVAAAYLSANPGATPAQVAAAITGGATPGKVGDARSANNQLLNTRFLDAQAPIAVIASPANGEVVPSRFVIEADVTDPNLDTVEVLLDDQVLDVATSSPFVVQADGVAAGPHAITIRATDHAGQTAIESITVTVTGQPPVGEPSRPSDGAFTAGGCSATGSATFALPVLALLLLLARRRKAAALALVVAACTVGEEAVIYVDSDGDGISDGVDTDGDGERNYETPACTTCPPGGTPVCTRPIVDTNNDGTPEGLDLDCDGDIDIELGGGGGGTTTTGQSKCVAIVAINNTKKEIACTSTNGGPASCQCKLNDQLVKTCTTSTKSACSIGGSTNCCGF